jgi:hypothetical protein
MRAIYWIIFTMVILTTYAMPCTVEDDKCTDCTELIYGLTYYVRHYNRTIQDITNVAEDLCVDIGGKIIGEECTYIIGHIQEIVDWIQQGSTATWICQQIGFCPK